MADLKELQSALERGDAPAVEKLTQAAVDEGVGVKEILDGALIAGMQVIGERFKNNEYNILVSTSVAEEGLDIDECDLVIFYDAVPSEIRLIQRRGRTARNRDGKVILLYCLGTSDERNLNISMSKL